MPMLRKGVEIITLREIRDFFINFRLTDQDLKDFIKEVNATAYRCDEYQLSDLHAWLDERL